MKISEIVIDEFTYPRPQLDKQNISILLEKLKAGTELDPIEVQKVRMSDKKEITILTNGAHRLEAYKEFNKLKEYDSVNDISVEYWKNEVLDYEQNKDDILQHAYKTNDEQGLNMRTMDTKATARKLRKRHHDWSAEFIGKKLDRAQSTIQEHIQDIIQGQRASEQQLIVRLGRLGWKQNEIAECVKVNQSSISRIIDNMETNKINNFYKQGKSPNKIGEMFDIDEQTVWNIILDGKSDEEQFELLDLKPKVYDSWNFAGCHKLMGQDHPGQIPGQVLLNTLYYFTDQEDTIIDLFAGGGTTNDACLLFKRKCYSYDIVPKRKDIIQADCVKDFPEDKIKKAKLVFLDPPYWHQKQGDYSEHKENFANMDLDTFHNTLEQLIIRCLDTMDNGKVALIIGNTQETGKVFYHGLEMFHRLYDKYSLKQRINVPYNTQNDSPATVSTAKKGKYMLKMCRDLLIFEKV